ncbi:hypothetical protein Anas_02621 [Armadillidium nasatum]|uniref:MARVEL domain-containing protein n=1 Tax=Armadillidium nasatum TaxID=96803 RepID=A0A5N5TGC5_9CRUS|nr:hypothetical protein Anas_02621 [Armadillidium nasatum]
MQVATVPVVTKFIEILFAVVIIGVYYGTHTLFKVKDYELGTDPDNCNAADNFGQFVIIGGLILGIVMIGVTLFLEKSKVFALVVIVYNVIWFVFYLTGAILILSYWSDPTPDLVCFPLALIDKGIDANDSLEKMRNGGITVGSFMLFENVLLIINTISVFIAIKK